MIRLLNYAHPITDDQHAWLEAELDEEIQITHIPCHLDTDFDFAPQIVCFADAAKLTSAQWQGAQILLNPPSLATAAVLLLAEIHGRMGHYPPCIRLQASKTAPPVYSVAEIMDLRKQRMSARGRR